jgi:hypothetical protein
MLQYMELFTIGLNDGASLSSIPGLDRGYGSGRIFLKRLFITRQGHIGMGPAAAQPGDRISLLYNTSCPMVLRPHDDFYRLVGGSYLDQTENLGYNSSTRRPDLRCDGARNNTDSLITLQCQ